MRWDGCPRCGKAVLTKCGRVDTHNARATSVRDGNITFLEGHVECRGSYAVPWRTGTPDDATVRRHAQSHPMASDVVAAFFQVRVTGMFPGVVSAAIDKDGTVAWGYGFDRDAAGQYHAGLIAMTPPGDTGPRAWSFRPLDITSHDVRPWCDVDGAAEGT